MEISDKTKQKLQELQKNDKIRILFVCLGNICRSPAAEGVMKALVENEGQDYHFFIDSAGTGNYHIGDLPDNRMRIHARRRGYDLTHRARQFKTADFDNFDLIIPMDESNFRNIKRMARTVDDEKKIIPMASFLTPGTHYDYIPDPYYEGSDGFELVLDLLENGLHNLFEMLKV